MKTLITTEHAVKRFVGQLKREGFKVAFRKSHHEYEGQGYRLRILGSPGSERPLRVDICEVATFDRWANSVTFFVNGLPKSARQMVRFCDALIPDSVRDDAFVTRVRDVAAAPIELNLPVVELSDRVGQACICICAAGFKAYIPHKSVLLGCNPMLSHVYYQENAASRKAKAEDILMLYTVPAKQTPGAPGPGSMQVGASNGAAMALLARFKNK